MSFIDRGMFHNYVQLYKQAMTIYQHLFLEFLTFLQEIGREKKLMKDKRKNYGAVDGLSSE